MSYYSGQYNEENAGVENDGYVQVHKGKKSIINIIGAAIITISCLFLPYIAYLGEITYSGDRDYKYMTLFKIIKSLSEAENQDTGFFIFFVVMLFICIAGLLISVFKAGKKSVIIFLILINIVSFVIRAALKTDKIVYENRYSMFIAFYAIFVGTIVNIVGLVIGRIKNR